MFGQRNEMPPSSQQAKFTGNWTFPYYQKEKSIHFQVLIVTCAINNFYMVVQHVIFSFLLLYFGFSSTGLKKSTLLKIFTVLVCWLEVYIYSHNAVTIFKTQRVKVKTLPYKIISWLYFSSAPKFGHVHTLISFKVFLDILHVYRIGVLIW